MKSAGPTGISDCKHAHTHKQTKLTSHFVNVISSHKKNWSCTTFLCDAKTMTVFPMVPIVISLPPYMYMLLTFIVISLPPYMYMPLRFIVISSNTLHVYRISPNESPGINYFNHWCARPSAIKQDSFFRKQMNVISSFHLMLIRDQALKQGNIVCHLGSLCFLCTPHMYIYAAQVHCDFPAHPTYICHLGSLQFTSSHFVPVVKCPNLTASLVKASVNTSAVVYNTAVQITCDVGHTFPGLIPSLVTTCTDDSVWDTEGPYECKRKSHCYSYFISCITLCVAFA